MTSKHIKVLAFFIFFFGYVGHVAYMLRPNIQTIQVGNSVIQVEVADNDYKIALGLMFKKTLPDYDGMLFIFKENQIGRFWMKNTYMPLDIAFIDDLRQIKEIKRMYVLSDKIEESSGPIKYALEVPLGFFEQEGITPGDFINLSF